MNEKLEKARKSHPVGLIGVLQIASENKVFSNVTFIFSIVSTLTLLSVIFSISSNSIFLLIKMTSDMVCSAFPDIVGFSLGGYAFAFSFSDKKIVSLQIAKSKYTLFQKASATFAFLVVVQVITLMIGFFFKWFIESGIQDNKQFFLSEAISHFFNLIALLLICFMTVFSLLTTISAVISIFTLSQVNHANIVSQILNEEKNENASS